MLQSNKRVRSFLPLADSAIEADSKEGAMNVNSKVLPKEIAKTSQIRPKINQTSTKNRPKIDQKSIKINKNPILGPFGSK